MFKKYVESKLSIEGHNLHNVSVYIKLTCFKYYVNPNSRKSKHFWHQHVSVKEATRNSSDRTEKKIG